MRALTAFVRLSRPLFLYGGVAGVALGVAVAMRAGFALVWRDVLWAQAMVTAFQLMVHYANEYFDREGDRGGARTAWSGGSGVLAEGLLAPRVARVAALVCAAAGVAIALRFAFAGEAVAAGVGLGMGALAWSYSAPPLRMAARGLGEATTVLVVAVLVPLAGYAALAHQLDPRMVRAVLPGAAAMVAMMLGVEIPDGPSDLAAGKRTLVVRWGPLRAWYATALAATLAFLFLLADALSLRAGWFTLAVLPAGYAAFMLGRLCLGDPRPGSIAFWGVALYSLTVTGLVVVYAVPG